MTAYALFDNLEVTDPAGLARYAEGAARTVADHGGRYLAAARAWYDSTAYQPLKQLRHRSARTTAVLFDGPEPDGG